MASSRTSSTARGTSCPSEGPSPRSVERFRLAGPTPALDRRIHAVRPDLADAALADRLFAPHYARAQNQQVAALTVAVCAAPGGRAVSELSRGEGFAVLDRAGGWAWGTCCHDGYVGYVPADALEAPGEPTHVVHRPAALVFAEPDIKARVLARWPLGVHFEAEGGETFLRTSDGFVHQAHAQPLAEQVPDPVAIALSLAGTPYRWGGRSGDGIDCSGLVQRVFGLAGVTMPRDSDQQRAVGRALEPEEVPARGDLVFLPGHVGIMADGDMLVHANAHWMAVTIEPLADVLARAGGPDTLLARRRLG